MSNARMLKLLVLWKSWFSYLQKKHLEWVRSTSINNYQGEENTNFRMGFIWTFGQEFCNSTDMFWCFQLKYLGFKSHFPNYWIIKKKMRIICEIIKKETVCYGFIYLGKLKQFPLKFCKMTIHPSCFRKKHNVPLYLLKNDTVPLFSKK